jgi:hypothetical protein
MTPRPTPTLALALALSLLPLSPPALAQATTSTPAPALEGPADSSAAPSWKRAVDATGYLAGRFSFTRSRSWGLVPTDDQPQLQALLELNTQVKVSFQPHTFAYSDLSLVANRSGVYHAFRDGRDVLLDDHPTAAASPVVSLNELYASHELRPEVNLLVGKKRIAWGAGTAYNPTDLLNPRRDPTDPTFQRAGAWLAQIEAPLPWATFTLLFAPTVLEQQSGIPTKVLSWPDFSNRDGALHYQLAARAYALVADAELNAMLYFGNQSVDAFRAKPRLGLSASRFFFTDVELHVEALLQQGSPRQVVTGACVTGVAQAAACNAAKTPFLGTPRLDDTALLPRILLGTRRQFADDSMLSLEYLYQADGWGGQEYQDYANALGLLAQGRAAGLSVAQVPGAAELLGQTTSTDGLPSRFAFDPRGRHYLLASFQKPRIRDDFTATLTLVANLADLSSLVSTSLAWAATDWLTLTLYAFLPLPGPDSLAPKTPAGVAVSEYGAAPFAVRTLLELRAFY